MPLSAATDSWVTTQSRILIYLQHYALFVGLQPSLVRQAIVIISSAAI